jgi:hypothetical protein
MPWLHRLSCFRDDVIFLILLYQRWIYPVDYTLVNFLFKWLYKALLYQINDYFFSSACNIKVRYCYSTGTVVSMQSKPYSAVLLEQSGIMQYADDNEYCGIIQGEYAHPLKWHTVS